jgi:hypothetical protein
VFPYLLGNKGLLRKTAKLSLQPRSLDACSLLAGLVDSVGAVGVLACWQGINSRCQIRIRNSSRLFDRHPSIGIADQQLLKIQRQERLALFHVPLHRRRPSPWSWKWYKILGGGRRERGKRKEGGLGGKYVCTYLCKLWVRSFLNHLYNFLFTFILHLSLILHYYQIYYTRRMSQLE